LPPTSTVSHDYIALTPPFQSLTRVLTVTLAALEAANGQIQNFDLIYPDQVINIPVCPGSTCDVISYTIKSGDIFNNLAQTYHTTVGQIEALNPTAEPTKLAVGQVIQLPTNCKA
jgi:LysM repeat protein